MNTESWKIEVVNTKTNEVVDTIGKDGIQSIEKALRVERGLNINMNRKKFRTRIVQIEAAVA